MNICIFGDSITWGAYDPINGGWATLLRNYLEEKYDDVATYNLGICGNNSEDLLKRFEDEAIFRTPNLIILAIGANDVKHQNGEQVLFDKFRKNIDQLINEAKKITSKVLIVGLSPVDEKLTTPRNRPPYNFRENKDVTKFNTILETAAEKHEISFTSIFNQLSMNDLFDGLHPNTKGHLKIFEKIKPTVDKLISD